ncbi:DUF423 domain-containing protein [Kordiimonas sp.]|uniref:DUF423 domain-containing protein n=1 Tax=Kordiimonas sp. TaxID=1970157 RepID=UPI003A8E4CCA
MSITYDKGFNVKHTTVAAIAALNGLIATAASALGAHFLSGKIAEADKALFTQAATFQFYHTFALLGLAWLMSRSDSANRVGSYAANAFLLGIIAFSGSLYVRAVMGPGSLGAFHWVTPIGGLALMLGWGLMALTAFKGNKR